MKIALVTVGSFKSSELERLTSHYLKLAGRFCQIELETLTLPKGLAEAQAQNEALAHWLEKKGTRIFLTLLDERGKSFTSREFAAKTEKIMGGSYTHWVIAVGGAHGYGEELRSKAQLLWSLSPMTMAHELACAVAAEQVFRGLSILHRHPYHND